jgi:hypothetical protein
MRLRRKRRRRSWCKTKEEKKELWERGRELGG